MLGVVLRGVVMMSMIKYGHLIYSFKGHIKKLQFLSVGQITFSFCHISKNGKN